MTNRVLFAVVVALIGIGVHADADAGFRVIDQPVIERQVELVPATLSIGSPSVATAPARAGYKPLDGSDLPAPAQARPSSSGFGLVALTYVGSPPAAIEVRQGMGRDVRLADALRQVAPTGWRGFGRADIADTFDPNRRVSWKGGRPWTDVLDILANEQDLAIEVDWGRKHLYVGKREYLGTAVATAAAKPPIAPPKPVWIAKAGETVRSTVEEWSRKAGWTVVWPMLDLDYRIVAPLSFDGSIVDATGKLTRLYESAERPLAVDIRVPQKVIVYSELGANP